MKKLLLQIFTAALLTIAAHTVFADSSYRTTHISIEEAMQAKTAHAKSVNTVITVMNFSDYEIQIAAPTHDILRRHSAARIISDASNSTLVHIIDGKGQTIFEGVVHPLAMIKIDVENNHYTFSVT